MHTIAYENLWELIYVCVTVASEQGARDNTWLQYYVKKISSPISSEQGLFHPNDAKGSDSASGHEEAVHVSQTMLVLV